MKHSLLSLFVFLHLLSFSQTKDSGQVIGIHPTLGKSITQDEKARYHLFPEYQDSLFESAKIFKYNDSTFLLIIKPIHAAEITRNISTKELDAIYYKVEEDNAAVKKAENSYTMTEEEKKAERRKQHSDYWDDALAEFFSQLFIVTIEVLITAAFSN